MPLWTIYTGRENHPAADILAKGLLRAAIDGAGLVALLTTGRGDAVSKWAEGLQIRRLTLDDDAAREDQVADRLVIACPGSTRGQRILDLICASDRVIVPVMVRQNEDNLDSLLETLNLLDALRDNALLDREIARHAAVFAPSVSGQKAALEMAQLSDRPPHHVTPMMADLMDPEEVEVEISAWTRRTLMALPVHRPLVDLKYDRLVPLTESFSYLDHSNDWSKHAAIWQQLVREIQAARVIYPRPVKVGRIGETIATRRLERETVQARGKVHH